jgi:hypothetical protein
MLDSNNKCQGKIQCVGLAEKRGYLGWSEGVFFGLDFLPARLTPVGRGYFLCQDKKYEEEKIRWEIWQRFNLSAQRLI